MNISELGLELLIPEPEEVKIADNLLVKVKSYLTMDEKVKLIEYVVSNSMDPINETFSPLMVELFFSLGVCKWYADIDCGDLDPLAAYDLLESNNVFTLIIDAIPQLEFNFIREIVETTVKDVARYSSSAAGIIHSMSLDANSMNDTLTNILGDIDNAKGLDVLSAIQDINGKRPVVVKKG